MISVVIPIYNVAEYLAHCLKSTYSQEQIPLEVILVNDGSTDASLSICYEFRNRFPSITKVIDKENGGLSDARNIGVENANGEWIFFLDSDDWLAPGALKRLFNFAIDNDCDVVQGGYYYAYDSYLLYNDRCGKMTDHFVMSRDQTMKELIKQKNVKNFAWGKLYKAAIVKKHSFPVGKYFEDSYWQHHIINETVNYGVLFEPLYFYRQRPSSISGRFSINSLDLLIGNEERLKFIQETYPQLVNMMASSFWKLSYDFNKIAQNSTDFQTASAFILFWKRINIQYKEIFDVALGKDVLYCLNKVSPSLSILYLFMQRIFRRLFGRDLKRINL